ncbi:TPA: helix-turn-helix domain-containing protein [Salmonella enterica subsp. enterica serovar Yopougon]
MRGNCVTFFHLRQYGLHFSAYFLSSVKRACKYRFYPTPVQAELLGACVLSITASSAGAH